MKSASEREQKILNASKARTSFSWRSPFGLVYQLPLLVIFLIAVFAPEDVLERYSVAARFTSSVRGFLLGIFDLADIKRFADSTDYPQVALLVCALHWAWLPMTALISALIFEYVRAREGYVYWRYSRQGNGRVTLKDLKTVVGGSLLFLAGSVAATMMSGDSSWTPGLTTKSRWGMGLAYWIIFWCCELIIGTGYPTIRAFIDVNLRGK